MQVLQAGPYKYILLELEPELISNIVRQAGLESRMKDTHRSLTLDLSLPSNEGTLLLFDAADPANLGWFSRCQFYIDGRSGAVMQTPIAIANRRDRGGRALPYGLRVSISKELPATFRLPGKQPLTEQVFYALLFNFLSALTKTGVAICGGPGSVVQALAGRTETPGTRQ
jgi:hypothetical protein